jgi:p-hydroxybenzoate 3-monooxygenase
MMHEHSTQVAIIGAGPAGLLLSHLLAQRGVESVVIESRSRAYCEDRVRAGLLEQGSVDLLERIGCAGRLHREGLVHDGTWLRFGGTSRHFNFTELVGKHVTIYGQQEIVRDLIAARIEQGLPLEFEVSETAVHDVQSARPSVTYRDRDGIEHTLHCTYIAGCDGFHGIARDAVPGIRAIEHAYPFAWLGILAKAPPLRDELVYVHTDDGFALFTMRSPSIARSYLQVPVDESIDTWPDERIWNELRRRLGEDDTGPPLVEGPILKKEVTPMRSFVAEPMQYGQLFLAGDAAHIVPPTGAKGMNLALGDAALLATGIVEAEAGDDTLLHSYSSLALDRVWKAERFSYWMTTLMHVQPDSTPFRIRMQLAEMNYISTSRAPAMSFAENYVGLPFAVELDRIAPRRVAELR